MTKILHIESAINVCSVCISQNGEPLSILEQQNVRNHSSLLPEFISKILKNNSLSFRDLSAVSVSSGPGSYTGLRIGLSIAKGICFGQNLPLISVLTPHSMANMLKQAIDETNDGNIILIPMIDAGRMEVFTAVYDYFLNQQTEIEAIIIDENFFKNFSTDKKIIIGGNGAEKCKTFIEKYSNFKIISDNIHSSQGQARIAYEKFLKKDFVDIAYFEPYYLKDYIPGKPRVKGLY